MYFKVKFPILCHPGGTSLLIIGNDLLKLLNVWINVTVKSIIVSVDYLFVGCPKESKESIEGNQDDYLSRLNVQVNKQARRCVQELSAKRPLTTEERKAAASISADSKEDMINVSRVVKGYDLAYGETFLYCRSKLRIEHGVTVSAVCATKDWIIRKGHHYVVRPICNRVNGELRIENEMMVGEEILHPDSTQISLKFTSPSVAYITPGQPCATIKASRHAKSFSVKEMEKYLDEKVVTSDFTSTFEPQTYHPDLPLPLTQKIIEQVREYTAEEWDEVRKEKDKLLKEENGLMYMTPKPKVKIRARDSAKDYSRHLMLSKQLSLLPDNVWSQETPDVLPGIPMSDLMVRVRLTPGEPIAEKQRRMSQAEHETAREQLASEIALGLWEPSQAPWAVNLT